MFQRSEGDSAMLKNFEFSCVILISDCAPADNVADTDLLRGDMRLQTLLRSSTTPHKAPSRHESFAGRTKV